MYMKRSLIDKSRLKSKKLLLVGLFFGLSSGSALAGTIENSVHDFRTYNWTGQGGQICIVCHTPHHAQDGATAPLWNHEITTATFQMYESTSFDGAATRETGPTGASKMCLSCHDGTVALDSFGANIPSGGAPLGADSRRNVGTDLRNDHPISFKYDTALSQADPGLFDPTTKEVTIGQGADSKPGTIATVMLEGGDTLQCSTCHDVHNKFAIDQTPLLRVDIAGSKLCLTCHNK